MLAAMSSFCEDEAQFTTFFSPQGIDVSSDATITYIDWPTGN
jgi:hypothetical protein